MIPWTDFEISSPCEGPENIPVPLQEHWLSWLPQTSTMTERFIESPMLEIAHERQFVISQIGGFSSDFESEHTRRIDECICALDCHFRRHATDELCPPSALDDFDVRACWQPDTPLEALPSWSISAGNIHKSIPTTPELTHKQKSPSPIPTPTSEFNSTIVVGPASVEIGDGEASDEMEEQFKQTLLFLPRARDSCSNSCGRSQKMIRQRHRRRFTSKLTNESALIGTKRNQDCVTDRAEDAAAIAVRSQSIASLLNAADARGGESTASYLSYRDDT